MGPHTHTHYHYPILFGFKDLIAGQGFFAAVLAQGRALLAHEGDGFWMSGVNPGSVAGGGIERADAFHAFKERYLAVLYDIAAEATTFEAFKQEVGEFFHSVNEETSVEWQTALKEVRAGRLNSDLQKVDADQKLPSIQVFLVEATPQANAFDDEIAEAA